MSHRIYDAPLHYTEPRPRPGRFWIAFAFVCVGHAIMIAGTVVPDDMISLVTVLAGVAFSFVVGRLAKLPTVPVNGDRSLLLVLAGVLLSLALFYFVGLDKLKFRYVTFERISFTWFLALPAYQQIAGALRATHPLACSPNPDSPTY